jgi:hypothetical protein
VVAPIYLMLAVLLGFAAAIGGAVIVSSAPVMEPG